MQLLAQDDDFAGDGWENWLTFEEGHHVFFHYSGWCLLRQRGKGNWLVDFDCRLASSFDWITD